MVFIVIFFFTKIILYFKMYKYVSETLNIPKFEKNVRRKKIKRVNCTSRYAYLIIVKKFHMKIGVILYTMDKHH